MNYSEEIWIIGTDPPCPRCGYLTKMTHQVINELGLSLRVRHLAFTDPEAREFASSLGLTPGTAKDVAKLISVNVDWERVYELTTPQEGSEKQVDVQTCCGPEAVGWTPELDEILRPCEEAAVGAGILMTPVLVVAGELKHKGSVPRAERVQSWIEQAFGKGKTREDRLIVEVLGTGCKNCDDLYENVFRAVENTDLQERVSVRRIGDIEYFAEKGVKLTPGLVIEGKVVSQGRVPKPDRILEYMRYVERDNFPGDDHGRENGTGSMTRPGFKKGIRLSEDDLDAPT
jgi:hypothetical protein